MCDRNQRLSAKHCDDPHLNMIDDSFEDQKNAESLTCDNFCCNDIYKTPAVVISNL